MHVATVKITPIQTDEAKSLDARTDFWSLAPAQYEVPISARERRLRTDFSRALTENLQDELRRLNVRPRGERLSEEDQRILRKIERVRVRVEGIWYGSLNIELGIPDIDSVLDLLGNNSELIETILHDYIPRAFSSATEADSDQFDFQATISPAFRAYVNMRQADGRPPKRPRSAVADEDNDPKQKGLKIATEVIRSPLVFPVILICFLWYIARQDTLAERQIVAGLMQSLLQQQTATVALLRDVAIKEAQEQEKKAAESGSEKDKKAPKTDVAKSR